MVYPLVTLYTTFSRSISSINVTKVLAIVNEIVLDLRYKHGLQ